MRVKYQVLSSGHIRKNKKKLLQLQAGSLTLDAADDGLGSVLGDDLVIVKHGEFCEKVS
jgi:hypothetical protein